MNSWFADTFFFLALRNPADAGHTAALEVAKQQGARRLVTTEWVLTEVGDALAAPKNRDGFMRLLTILQSDPQVTIVESSNALFERGVELYQRRADKHWTLTDCISFVVMQEHGITVALTGDHHFEQAGFHVLLS